MAEKEESFKKRFERQAEKHPILSKLTLTKKPRCLKFETNKFHNIDSTLSLIIDVLQALQDLDFSGLHVLKIEIDKFQGQVNLQLGSSALRILSGLRNLSRLQVSSNVSDPYLIFLFSSFELTEPSWQIEYSFKAQLPDKEITLEQQFVKNKLECNFDFTHSFINNTTNLNEVPIFQNFYTYSTMHRSMKDEGEVEDTFLPSISKIEKKILFSIRIKNYNECPKNLSIKHLFQLWNLDVHRIKTVEFTIGSIGSSIYNSLEESFIDISSQELKSLNIYNKVRFIYPALSPANELTTLTKLVESAKKFQIELRFGMQYQNLIQQLDQLYKGKFSNVEEIYITGLSEAHAQGLILVASNSLPNLKRFIVRTSQTQAESESWELIEQIMDIVSRTKTFEYNRLIKLYHSKLKIQFYMSDLNQEQAFFKFPSLLKSLNKDIYLDVMFSCSGRYFDYLIQFFQSINNASNILSFFCSFQYIHPKFKLLQLCTNERNSQVVSIIPFIKFILPLLTFDPKASLYDLYMFES